MLLNTPIPFKKSDSLIDYDSKIISLGSCFAANMGDKFQYFKLQNVTNPFGIIFNPVSIEKIVNRVVNNTQFTAEDVFFHNEQWHCFEVHSEMSSSNKEELIQNLNQILHTTKKHLQEATHFIITYGTAWIYKNIERNCIVANCHKVPQKQFAKELLSVETIQNSIQNTIELIQTVNPDINFIFTISPVRHIKDGFIENQVSKAHIITALYDTVNTENYKRNTEYFPSYEIMMDELRDYRFYADDMIHPSPIAIDYIWERLKKTIFSETIFSTMDTVENIQKSIQHRPFNKLSESHQRFEANLKEKITKLVAQYSFMKF